MKKKLSRAPEAAQADLFGQPTRPAVLVSRCLLGVPCRYHGKATAFNGFPIGRPKLIAKLRERYTLIDVCPECDGGLPTPRPPTRIIDGRWIADGNDVTAQFRKGTRLAIAAARKTGAQRAYLVKNSPACDRDIGMLGRALRELGLIVINP